MNVHYGHWMQVMTEGQRLDPIADSLREGIENAAKEMGESAGSWLAQYADIVGEHMPRKEQDFGAVVQEATKQYYVWVYGAIPQFNVFVEKTNSHIVHAFCHLGSTDSTATRLVDAVVNTFQKGNSPAIQQKAVNRGEDVNE